MYTLFPQLEQSLSDGIGAVLVLVAETNGSSPRGIGAAMLVPQQGQPVGTIGGGLLEHRCIQRAQSLFYDSSVLEALRLDPSDPLSLDMACGGELQVLYRPFSPNRTADTELVCSVNACLCSGTASWLVFQLDHEPLPGTVLSSRSFSQRFGEAVPGTHAQRLNHEGKNYLCLPLCQHSRVFIFGGGHVAQALVPILSAADFLCTVLEDREEFCRPERFPGAEQTRLIDLKDPSTYPSITNRDYVCIMTRGHEHDLAVQTHVLRTPARYIGVMGSRRKAQAAFAALRGMGFSEDTLSRITTPIGLDIGADTPAEIAVSIAAQLIYLRSRQA